MNQVPVKWGCATAIVFFVAALAALALTIIVVLGSIRFALGW